MHSDLIYRRDETRWNEGKLVPVAIYWHVVLEREFWFYKW